MIKNVDHRSIPVYAVTYESVDSEHRKLCSCQIQTGLRWGGKCNGLATNTSLVLWCAIMKCQQQISFLKLTKTESRNERVTSPGPALPSEACQFIFTLNRNRSCYESPLPGASCGQFQMERLPHEMTKVSPRRKNNNKFIYTCALKWILTQVSSREKRMH